jgi:uncharacterized protein (TIGR02001 family)
MNKLITTSTLALALMAPLAAQAADAPPLTGNVTLASEYLYRGIAQTNGKAALQGGFDYNHASGFYAGVWGSNISWLSDAGPGISAPLELDVYGGYKGSLADGIGYDVGVLTYNYPGSYPAGMVDPDTTEIYGAASWKFLTFKYSHAVSSHLFGFTTVTGGKTKGSGYSDLSANFDLGGGWGVNAHVGHQTVKDNSAASYTDYKVGATKDVGFGTVGLYYSGTNAKGGVGEPYRNPYNRDLGDDRLVISFSKTL